VQFQRHSADCGQRLVLANSGPLTASVIAELSKWTDLPIFAFDLTSTLHWISPEQFVGITDRERPKAAIHGRKSSYQGNDGVDWVAVGVSSDAGQMSPLPPHS